MWQDCSWKCTLDHPEYESNARWVRFCMGRGKLWSFRSWPSSCLHQAPGEAEAELAWMNKADIVNVVLTDDSDAVIFGA